MFRLEWIHKVKIVVMLSMFYLGVIPTTASATKKVYSPKVDKGEWGFETRGSYDFDDIDSKDDTLKFKHEIEYGITDKWKTALVVEVERERPDGLEATELEWENIFELTEPGDKFIDLGVYLAYVAKFNNKPDKLESRLLFEKKIEGIKHTLNINFDQEIENHGSNDLEGGVAWRSKWYWKKILKPGFEYHVDFGAFNAGNDYDEQKHQVGPVLYGKIGDHFEYEIGYLFGTSDAAPDGSLKWLFEYEIEF